MTMKGRIRFLGTIPMLTVTVLVALMFLWGCEGDEPMAHNDHAGHDHAGHDHAAMNQSAAQEHAQQMGEPTAQMSAEQPTAQAAAIEQTTCPIMEGNAIKKNLFVEYKGKKVYFCCPGCPEKFLENPEKYVAKLPQFQDSGEVDN
jgi:YHS domain-containing protein